MGSLLVVTGPPGSGKSTVSRVLADRMTRSVLVEGDAFYAFLAAGATPPWLPESNDQNLVVADAAAAATARFVVHYDVVYDGVLGPWHLDRFMRAACVDVLDYALLLPPIDTCVERVATRLGHGFTDGAAARHMHDQFASADVERRHVVAEATAGAVSIADSIEQRRRTGSLRHGLDPST